MIFIILAGSSRISFFFKFFFFWLSLSLSLIRNAKQVFSLSFSSFSFLWIALYISMSFILHRMVTVYPLLIFRVCRFVESRRLPSYSSFVLPLPLFITPTLIVTVTHHKHVGLVLSHICTTKVDHSIYNV